MNTEDTIKKFVKDKKIPCISVGIINKDGNTKEFHYGEIKKGSNITPTSNTIYEIGSMTKTFTALLAVKLQEEGLLSLDDPITKYLPEFIGTDFDKNKITLYHLITHTSGIVEIPLRDYPKNILKMIFRTGNGKLFPPKYSYATSKFLQEVSKIKLKDKSGITARYSNTGVGLVGKILERITNSTYEDLIKNYICDELEMSDTGITLSDQHKEKLATGYMYTGKEANPINIPGVMSAGSIRSTTSDILEFLKANLGLNSKQDLSSVMQYCTSSLIEPKMNPILKRILPKPNDIKSMKLGLGWVVSDYGDDVKFVWHNGGTEGFSTAMAINPRKNTGCVVLTNKAFVDSYKFGSSLLKTI